MKWKQCAIMDNRWHLISGEELYDMEINPGQTTDVAAANPEIVGKLRTAYETWWNDISKNFDDYCEIIIDTNVESPIRLTSHDTHTPTGVPTWNQVRVRQGARNNGFWVIDIAESGTYEFALRRYPVEAGRGLNETAPPTPPVPGGVGYPEGVRMNIVRAQLEIDGYVEQKTVTPDAEEARFSVALNQGIARMKATFTDKDGEDFGAYYVYVIKTD